MLVLTFHESNLPETWQNNVERLGNFYDRTFVVAILSSRKFANFQRLVKSILDFAFLMVSGKNTYSKCCCQLCKTKGIQFVSIAARTGNCNFEEKWWCRWQQWYNDDFNWLRATTTGGVGTGPNGDHTTGKGINCLVDLVLGTFGISIAPLGIYILLHAKMP